MTLMLKSLKHDIQALQSYSLYVSEESILETVRYDLYLNDRIATFLYEEQRFLPRDPVMRQRQINSRVTSSDGPRTIEVRKSLDIKYADIISTVNATELIHSINQVNLIGLVEIHKAQAIDNCDVNITKCLKKYESGFEHNWDGTSNLGESILYLDKVYTEGGSWTMLCKLLREMERIYGPTYIQSYIRMYATLYMSQFNYIRYRRKMMKYRKVRNSLLKTLGNDRTFINIHISR